MKIAPTIKFLLARYACGLGGECLVGVVDLVKRVAVEAIEAQKPVEILFGRCVISGDSHSVVVEQKLTLTGEQVVFMKNITVNNGDYVLLFREQGGQRFFVIGVI